MRVVYLTYFQKDFFINLFCKTRKLSLSLAIEVVGEAVSVIIVDSDTKGSTQKQKFPECLVPCSTCSAPRFCMVQPKMLFLGF